MKKIGTIDISFKDLYWRHVDEKKYRFFLVITSSVQHSDKPYSVK